MSFINFHNLLIKKSKVISRKGLYHFLAEQYDLIPDKSKILLVGSGGKIADHLYKFASRKLFMVISIDIDSTKKPDIIGDVCLYEFGEDKYDAIIMAEVLEHFHNPQKSIVNIHKSLKKGGKAIITVPFIFPIHDRPYDYFRFTRYGLELLLKDFESIFIKDRNNWGEAISTLMARHSFENHMGKYFMLLMALSFYPLFFFLGKVFKTDFFTTGYFAVATK